MGHISLALQLSEEHIAHLGRICSARSHTDLFIILQIKIFTACLIHLCLENDASNKTTNI